jgi:colicin import membrane protein
MSDADGVEDAVDGAMRTGLMVASRIGEQLARMREEDQRTIAAAEEHRARQLQERFDAERAAARAQLAPVARDDWWDKANPEMIERAHETATAWKAYDPKAAQAAEQIREQVQSRYGIEVNNTGAGEASVSEALARAQQAGSEAETERTKAAAARTDETVAGAAVAGANRQDRESKVEPAWDSAERRQQLAQSLEGKGGREAVNSRLLADKHQGTHPSAAVAQKPSLAKTSKMAKQGGKGRTLERGGLER